MNTANTFWSRALSLVALLMSLSVPARAQVIGPTNPTPQLPQLQPLPTGTLAADNNGLQSVTVRWYQPINALSFQSVNPTHFAVCLRAAGIQCTWPAAATAGVFNGAATGSIFTRTAVTMRSPFIPNAPQILVGYNYSTTLSLNNSFFDRQLKWAVAACADASPNNCMSAVGPSVWYTTKELTANATFADFLPDVLVTAQGVNTGTTRADGFMTRITVFPALVGSSGACAIANETGLGMTDSTRLITRDGLVKFAGNYKVGSVYDFSTIDVVGIVHGTNTFGATTTMGLDPQTNVANLSPMVTRTVDTTLLPAQPVMPAKFGLVAISSVDDLGQIKEVNEGDNKWGQCKTYVR